MRILVSIVVVGVAAVVSMGGLRAAGEPPAWAYAIPPAPPGGAAPGAQPAQPDPTPRKLPGSTLSFPLATIRDAFGPADWFPGDHPAMPEIVAKGRRPDVRACALCHYPNGKGRPEHAAVAGLSWRRSEGHWAGAGDCRSIAELHGAADVRHAG